MNSKRPPQQGQSSGCIFFFLITFLLRESSSTPTAAAKPDRKSVAEQEAEAVKYFAELEEPFSKECNRRQLAEWDYLTNVTEFTEKAYSNQKAEYLKLEMKIQQEILAKFPNWTRFTNDTLRRACKNLVNMGDETVRRMPSSELKKMAKLEAGMGSDYSTVTVCEYENPSNCTLRLDPELEGILMTEKDPKKLAYYWTAWHDKMSEQVPPSKYKQYVDFQTALAKRSGFKDMFEMWMFAYDDESPDFSPAQFRLKMFKMWEEIRPLYEKLHAYVRMKLKRRPEYKGLIGKCGYIPAYLTGNMWAQKWKELDPITKPYPESPSLDATEAMIKKNYTILKMYQIAEEFYTGLGLPKMTSTFWEKSMLTRPDDGREVVCHPMAFDMCLGKGNEDFRIKQCTKVDMGQLFTVHHEMGHISYYQEYTNQDIVFRNGANPGFHEAIGDSLALAVLTPEHLQCKLELELGLDPSLCDDKPATTPLKGKSLISKSDVNYLYITALAKVAFIPFTITVDAWRWEAFEGKLLPEEYNRRWWELRMMNQGVEPSSKDRINNPNLFDAAAKYHIVGSVEYLRYYISLILQFQFYEAMCIAAGKYNPKDNGTRPLFQCDFAGSKEAGKVLGDMLKLGSSKGWPAALEAITGSRSLSMSSLINYFQPLADYLEKELEKNGEVPGFGKNC